MFKPLIKTLITTSLAAACTPLANATGVIDKIELSGLFESELSISSKSGDVQSNEFIFTPEIGVDLTDTSRLTLIGRLRGSTENHLDHDRLDIELREAYVDMDLGNAFLRLGKQQVVWGQADGLKVLDVINPQSFREFILDDFEDSRIPLWMVNAEIPVGEALLQLLWIPDQTYDDIPRPDTTFAFTSPLVVPELPAGVPVSIASPNRPDDLLADSDVGIKLSAFIGGWDLSLNYAYHYFDRPVLRRTISQAGISVQADYERTHLLGGTFSNVFGDFTLRGEVGFSSDRYFLTDDRSDADGVVDSSELSYVLGLDYQGWRDWFVSAQIFQSVISDPAPGMVRDRVDSTGTLMVRRDLMNDALQVEFLVIQNLNQNDGVLQASLIYELRSNIRLRAGTDIFYGNSQGLFGQFDEEDRVSIGIEVGF